MDAHITVSGNVGSDLDIFEGDGFIYTRFRLASTPRQRKAGEWVDGTTTWIGVQATGRLAENLRDSVSKGQAVLVSGRLRTQIWTSEGLKHDRIIIEATSVGHDLNRGVSAFTRRTSARPAESGDQSGPAPSEGDDAVLEGAAAAA